MKRIELIQIDSAAVAKFCDEIINATPRRVFAMLYNLTAEQVEQNPAALPCDVLDEIRAEIETYINATIRDLSQIDDDLGDRYAVALSFLNTSGTFEQVARAIAPESGTPDTSTPRPVYQVHAEPRTDEPAPESGTGATNTGGACMPYTLQTNKTRDELNAIFDRLTEAGFVEGDTDGHDERRRDFLNAFAVTNDGGAGRIVWTEREHKSGILNIQALFYFVVTMIGGNIDTIKAGEFARTVEALFVERQKDGTTRGVTFCRTTKYKYRKTPNDVLADKFKKLRAAVEG